MSARLALAATILCTLVGGGQARADEGIPEPPDQRIRRPVAVIELSDSPDGRNLAERLVSELNNRDDLRPLDRRPRQTTLSEPSVDEEAEKLATALKAKEAAENQVSDFKFVEARDSALAGLRQLQGAAPTPPVVALYAQLSFALGAAKLGDRKDKEAAVEFRFAHTLDPAFRPDGVRYLPDFLQAYEAAIKVATPAAKITVTGTGRVFVDGRDTGDDVHESRQTFDIKAGKHVVWLVGADRLSHAEEVAFVAADRKEEVNIDPTSTMLDDTTLVRRLKLALKKAPDPAARAAAMGTLAHELDVKDAVLITQVNGKIIVQTWVVEPVTKDRSPGFSAFRELTDKDKLVDVLAPLLPPKKPVVQKKKDPPPFTPPIVVDDRHWYQKRKYQVAGGIGALVLGAAVYGFSSWDRTFGVGQPQFGGRK